MPSKMKQCGQTYCALAQRFPGVIHCTRIANPLLERDAGSAFTPEQDRVMLENCLSTPAVAQAMYTRSILLAQEGYSEDALCCYTALIASFEQQNIGTGELVTGAKHNRKMLQRLILLSRA